MKVKIEWQQVMILKTVKNLHREYVEKIIYLLFLQIITFFKTLIAL